MGSDTGRGCYTTRKIRISIHAPRVGSDNGQSCEAWEMTIISIHAPRVGSDASGYLPDSANNHFNPRSPCGERLFGCGEHDALPDISIHAPRVGSDNIHMRDKLAGALFQSTLPVWGATARNRAIRSLRAFQSTLPVWGATTTTTCQKIDKTFQSTLPVWGATKLSITTTFSISISIHAPRVGSDRRTIFVSSRKSYFNPRSPCGERLCCS